MKVSVHQSQYLPYLGYFHKIVNSDIFVFLDNVQYKKREFQNRNKILSNDNIVLLTVPVKTKGKYYQKISDVEIDNSIDWKKSHWETIKNSYNKAAFFDDVQKILSDIYIQNWNQLTKLNNEIIFRILDYLEINNVKIYFESDLSITGNSTERIINICKKLNADTYYSGIGGKEYMDMKMFEINNINCIFQDFNPLSFEYKQLSNSFIPYLSIIDLIANEGKNSKNILVK